MRSMKALLIYRSLPSIEIQVPTRFRRSVQAKDVNYDLSSMLMISAV